MAMNDIEWQWMTFARSTRLMAINRKISSNDPNDSNDPNRLYFSNSLTIKQIPPPYYVGGGHLALRCAIFYLQI